MMEKPNDLVEEGFIYPSPFRGDESHHYIMAFAKVAGILNGTKINASGRQPQLLSISGKGVEGDVGCRVVGLSLLA